jgi:hypothetical protein
MLDMQTSGSAAGRSVQCQEPTFGRNQSSPRIYRCQEEALRAECASLQYRHSRGKAPAHLSAGGAEHG